MYLREQRKPVDNTPKTEGTRRKFCLICYHTGQGRLDGNGFCRSCGKTYPVVAPVVTEQQKEQRYRTKATTKQPLFAFPLGQKKKNRKDGLTDEDLDDISSLMGGYKPESVNVVDSREEPGSYYY